MANNQRASAGRRFSLCSGTALLGGALLLASAGAPAIAQQAAPPTTLQEPSPKDPARDPVLRPGDEPLSERLEDTEGVITPPPTGAPGIQVEPPDPDAGSNMPVIPPPDETAPGTAR